MLKRKLAIAASGLAALATTAGCTAGSDATTANTAESQRPSTDSAETAGTVHTYQVTLQNLTKGQPLSIPVAATAGVNSPLHMFEVGNVASAELADIAQDGEEAGMAQLFKEAPEVTDVVDTGERLTPQGTAKGGYTDSLTFTIKAHDGDELSLATMLVCTNDGFTGVDRLSLPTGTDSTNVDLKTYDSGSEQNTESSADVPDGCHMLGTAPIKGKPNGNDDNHSESRPISEHTGIQENGALNKEVHDWTDPVARLTVVRLDGQQR